MSSHPVASSSSTAAKQTIDAFASCSSPASSIISLVATVRRLTEALSQLTPDDASEYNLRPTTKTLLLAWARSIHHLTPHNEAAFVECYTVLLTMLPDNAFGATFTDTESQMCMIVTSGVCHAVKPLLTRWPRAAIEPSLDGRRPLAIATARGANADAIRVLIESGGEAVLAPYTRGTTTEIPLHLLLRRIITDGHAGRDDAYSRIVIDAITRFPSITQQSDALSKQSIANMTALGYALLGLGRQSSEATKLAQIVYQSNPAALHLPVRGQPSPIHYAVRYHTTLDAAARWATVLIPLLNAALCELPMSSGDTLVAVAAGRTMPLSIIAEMVRLAPATAMLPLKDGLSLPRLLLASRSIKEEKKTALVVQLLTHKLPEDAIPCLSWALHNKNATVVKVLIHMLACQPPNLMAMMSDRNLESCNPLLNAAKGMPQEWPNVMRVANTLWPGRAMQLAHMPHGHSALHTLMENPRATACTKLLAWFECELNCRRFALSVPPPSSKADLVLQTLFARLADAVTLKKVSHPCRRLILYWNPGIHACLPPTAQRRLHTAMKCLAYFHLRGQAATVPRLSMDIIYNIFACVPIVQWM
jgi:hypothetical protein